VTIITTAPRPGSAAGNIPEDAHPDPPRIDRPHGEGRVGQAFLAAPPMLETTATRSVASA
jgi:hypothetical protein